MHNGQLGALEVRTTGPKRNDRLVMFGKAEFSAQMLHKQSIQAKARQKPREGPDFEHGVGDLFGFSGLNFVQNLCGHTFVGLTHGESDRPMSHRVSEMTRRRRRRLRWRAGHKYRERRAACHAGHEVGAWVGRLGKPVNTYGEAGGLGPNVSVVAADDGVLHHLGGDQLVVDVRLSRHDCEEGVARWAWRRGWWSM